MARVCKTTEGGSSSVPRDLTRWGGRKRASRLGRTGGIGKARQGPGMPRSRQIFLTSISLISLCLGTADRRPLMELPHQECLAPSLIR